MTPEQLRDELRGYARELGFSQVGFAPAAEPPRLRERLLEWLARGHQASMAWMERDPARRWDPEQILPGARSVVVVSLLYRTDATVPAESGLPRVSRYAQGRDYHEVLGERLHALRARLCELAPDAATRIACDTSPIADKAFAEAGGIGWIGKNSCLIHPEVGSWTFLGEIFTDVELPTDPPIRDHCGSCTRCLDACPTGAFPEPYVLDANRCIAYWNIEHRGAFGDGWDRGIGEWLVGCDVCQDVCPWNRKAPLSELADFLPDPGLVLTSAEEWEGMPEEEYRRRVRGKAISRVKPADMRRNAAAVRTNLRGSGDVRDGDGAAPGRRGGAPDPD